MEIDIEYKGKKYKCHPESWMAKFKKPIQDFTDEELLNVVQGIDKDISEVK